MRNLKSTRSTSYILKPLIRVFSRHKTNITSPTGHGTRSLLPGTKGPVHFDCWDRGTVEQCPSALPEVLAGTSLFDCWDRGTVEQCPSALPEVLGGITYTEGCPQDRRSRVWPSVGHILPQTSITSYAVFGIGQSKVNYGTHRCAYVVYYYYSVVRFHVQRFQPHTCIVTQGVGALAMHLLLYIVHPT